MRLGTDIGGTKTSVAAARPGTAASAGTLAYLNVGTGLPAAMIRDGVVQRGPGGALGEIEHLPVGGTVPCRCGQIGCLERLASGSAVARVWTPGSGEDRDPFVSQDPAARNAARMLCDGVVTALQLLVLACGPDRVAIGGGAKAADGARPGLPQATGSELTSTLPALCQPGMVFGRVTGTPASSAMRAPAAQSHSLVPSSA